MAGSHTCCNSLFKGKDELAGEAPTNGSHTSTPAVSWAQTPALTEVPMPAQTLAPAQTPAPAPGPPGRYTDKDLQRATKLALESFVQGQEHGQLQANSVLREQPLKAWFPNLYYHFKTAGANRPNQISFAASFLPRALVQRRY